MHQTCRHAHLTLAHCFFSCNHACDRIFVIPEGRAIHSAVVEKKGIAHGPLLDRAGAGYPNGQYAPCVLRSRIILYNLHLVEFNFFSQIEKTKRIAMNAMRVAWTKISAIDAFSRRFVVSIFKNPKVALLVNGHWEMRVKIGHELGNEHPKSLGSGNIQIRTFDAFPVVVSLSGGFQIRTFDAFPVVVSSSGGSVAILSDL
jgi:hypothetical protein